MPRALITAANCAALGAINGTGWLASDSSLSTSTNWNVLLLEIRRAGADFEHRHRIKGDMDCAVEDTQVGLPEMPCQPFGFDQKFGMNEIFCGCRHFSPGSDATSPRTEESIPPLAASPARASPACGGGNGRGPGP